MIRTIERLRQEQSEIMSSYRQELTPPETVAVLPRPGGMSSVGVFGRVVQVIGSDPDYGPHLVVRRQIFNGTPRSAADSPAATVRCYPTPNNTVGDYAVDEYVLIVTTIGAMVAQKLA